MRYRVIAEGKFIYEGIEVDDEELAIGQAVQLFDESWDGDPTTLFEWRAEREAVMKTLFGIKGYDRDYLLKLLDRTKAGRCDLPHEYRGKRYLYFTLALRGLRGIVDGRERKLEAFDAELKEAGYGNIRILSSGEYIDLLLERFGQEDK